MRTLIKILLLFTFFELTAIQWPVADLSPFDGFYQKSLTMDWIIAQNNPVPLMPIDQGELVFLYQPGDPGIPLSTQSLVVLEHETQYRSLYELSEVSSSLGQREFVGAKDSLYNRCTGFFRLAIWDLRSSAWVNPMLILPGIPDHQPVSVKAVYLQNQDGMITLQPNSTVAAGEYSVIIRALDKVDSFPDFEFPPYLLEARYLGNLIESIEFNGVQYRKGELYLIEGDMPLSDIVLDDQGLINLGLIQISPSNASLELQIADIQGNEQLLRFNIQGR